MTFCDLGWRNKMGYVRLAEAAHLRSGHEFGQRNRFSTGRQLVTPPASKMGIAYRAGTSLRTKGAETTAERAGERRLG